MQPPRNISMSLAVLTAIGLLTAPLKTQAGDEGPTGSIVGWGSQVVGVDLSGPFHSVAAGRDHSLALMTDGSIVAWGAGQTNTGYFPEFGQSIVPAPNADFIAVAAGLDHSLGLESDGSVAAWGRNDFGQTNLPAPNADFIAVAAGGLHSLGLKALRGDLNLDGRVDSADHVGMVACLAGPGALPPLGCNLAKLSGDSWVDLRDYAAFQSRFGAPFP